MDQEYAKRVGGAYVPWDRTAEHWPWPYWEPKELSQDVFHTKYGHLGEVIPDGRQRYLSHLLALDDGLVRILDTLDATKHSSDTLVILLSDNGGELNTYSNNQPLNGFKYMLCDGGIRIPVFVSLPGRLPEGQTCSQLVSAMDIVPTTLELAHIPVPKNLDGQSLLPVLNDPSARHHNTLVWDMGSVPPKNDKEWVVRRGDWKLVFNAGANVRNYRLDTNGVASSGPNFVYPNGVLLFNLRDDLGETKNLAAEHPELVKELTELHKTWRAQMEDPTPATKKNAQYEQWLSEHSINAPKAN